MQVYKIYKKNLRREGWWEGVLTLIMCSLSTILLFTGFLNQTLLIQPYYTEGRKLCSGKLCLQMRYKSKKNERKCVIVIVRVCFFLDLPSYWTVFYIIYCLLGTTQLDHLKTQRYYTHYLLPQKWKMYYVSVLC